MYCPSCSKEASRDQKFCRSCGMDLQAVAELVASQPNVSKQAQRREPTLDDRQRSMVIWGMILMLAAVGVGASLKILSKDQIHLAGAFTPYLSVISLLIAFFGMGLMVYPFLQTSRNRRSRPDMALTHEPGGSLEPEMLVEKPSSVTEHTTEFLEPLPLRTDVRNTAPQSD
jgi:hypothetical protein